jgi:hypothetical protein
MPRKKRSSGYKKVKRRKRGLVGKKKKGGSLLSFSRPIMTGILKAVTGRGINVAGGRKKSNPWIAHVKRWRKANPGYTYAEALKRAKASY